jgi:hypothetical protein
MAPTVRSGDAVLVRRGAEIRPGDVVLASFRALPGRLVIKRAVRRRERGWELSSDNPFAGGDSSVYGVADVHGRALLVLRRGWWPRLPAAGTPPHGRRSNCGEHPA